MTLKGGTKQACAACKFQRRKCTPECVLAPYFPADQPKAFQNVHKLFGVSNVEKILKTLEPTQKKIAMESIICQSNFRDKYPVRGCWEEICRLNYQIWYVEEELRAVHQQLEICRQHFLQQHQGCSSSLMLDDVTSQLELGMMTTTPRNNYALPLLSHNPLIIKPETHNSELAWLAVSDQHSYCNSNSSVGYNSMDVESKDHVVTPNSLWVHRNPCGDDDGDSMAMAMNSQLQLVASPPLDMEQKVVGEYYDEITPPF
ncbi:hypothetical protein QN277_006770 [Acacia crassicarpa]|uniref:LOB domain-containing protein n=1 Tax=Acacia crassicarpa TaxID=499986 RepID=A0AAE1ITH8_9FABA|nr:hypothetical protein QN277_006770 [Acacia crassicarpa]